MIYKKWKDVYLNIIQKASDRLGFDAWILIRGSILYTITFIGPMQTAWESLKENLKRCDTMPIEIKVLLLYGLVFIISELIKKARE